MKNLIIFRHCDAENNGCYIFEAMDPFLSLRSLSADIEKSVESVKAVERLISDSLSFSLIGAYLKLRFLNEK